MQDNEQVQVEQELRKNIWDGQIPVNLVLSEQDRAVENIQTVLSLYTFVKRSAYPSMKYSKILSFFKKSLCSQSSEQQIWLQYKGEPIPWNIPFGVTIDLRDGCRDYEKVQDVPFFPLEIIVHLRNYPTSLIPLDEDVKKQTEKIYKFCLQEASNIQYQKKGSYQISSEQSPSEWQGMWEGLYNEDYDLFFSQFDQIWQHKYIKSQDALLLPMRIYIQNFSGRIQHAAQIEKAEDSLGTLFCQLFPQIFQSAKENEFEVDEKYQNFQVISCGITLDLNTPLLYLYPNFHYWDGFVYLSLLL